MGLFGKNHGGLADVIRCDEPSYLIWKWHPSGVAEGKGKRENEIRFGSSLRVKAGSVAVFANKQNDGSAYDFIEGPYDGTLVTANLPVISKIIGLAFDGNSPFQAEVYFINLAQIIQTKFAVPFFDVYDPRFLDFGVPVAVRGSINFKIADYRDFIRLHRLESFTLEDFQRQVKDAVTKYVKSAVANAPEENGIPVVQIERKIAEINSVVEEQLKYRLLAEFGVAVTSVDISNIEIDKTSDGYEQLSSVTKALAAETARAQTEVAIEEMRAKQRLDVLERTANIEENQYARHKMTQSGNLAAYQVEAGEKVGVAGAKGLGEMGASASLGGASGGFNPAGMMAGMAIGGTIGQNIAGTMGNMMNGMGQSQVNTPNSVPIPPIPTNAYHVAVNGNSTGPFDLATLGQMVSAGQLNANSLVWKTGMAAWEPAGSVNELSGMFSSVPPIPPVQ